MGGEPFVVAPLEARFHKGANAESAAGGHLVVQAFTVTGNDFSTGDGVSPTIRAGADRQNTTPMVVVPVQDGRGMEKSQNGLGVGEPGDPMYTLDTTGAQAVAYVVVGDTTTVGTLGQDDLTQGCTTVQAAMSGLLVPMVAIPCQVDGSPVAATLRGFGHGWQGQHNTTNAVAQCINGDTAGTLDANYGKGPGERSGAERDVVVQSTRAWPLNERGRDDGPNLEMGGEGVYNALAAGDGSSSRRQLVLIEETVWEYDGYNQKLDDSGVHRTLRIGRDSSDFVAYAEPRLFEPMSLREENWAGRDVKNALRAEASRSSHAIVAIPISADTANGREGVSATPSADAEGNVRLRDPGLGVGVDGDPSYTISASSVPAVAVAYRPEPFAMLNFQGSKGNTVVNDGDVSFTINAMHGHDMHVVGYELRHIAPEIVGTITADMGEKFQVNNQSVMSGHLQVFTGDTMDNTTNLVVRRLTPLECELLMGWDPNWTAEGVEEDGTVVQMADTHRYRMCGNGVVSNVGEWIGARYVAARVAAEAQGG